MRRLERFALGPSLGQCCGGAVVLAFERLDVADLGWVTTLGKRRPQGLSTVRSVSFGAAPDAVMLSDPEPGVARSTACCGTAPASTTAARSSPRPSRRATSRSCCSARAMSARRWFACWPRCLARVRLGRRTRCAVPPWQTYTDNVKIDPNDAPDSSHRSRPRRHVLHRDDAQPCARSRARGTHPAARRFRVLRHDRLAHKRKQFEHRLAARGIDPVRDRAHDVPVGVDGIVDKAPEDHRRLAAAQLLQAVEAHARTRHRNRWRRASPA